MVTSVAANSYAYVQSSSFSTNAAQKRVDRTGDNAPPVSTTGTYTMDSEVSPLLPNGSSGENGSITILRGAAKSSEITAQSNTAGGESGAGAGAHPSPNPAPAQ